VPPKKKEKKKKRKYLKIEPGEVANTYNPSYYRRGHREDRGWRPPGRKWCCEFAIPAT
jgi:hypothetical protein